MSSPERFGIAVDLGTTTLAVSLVDLKAGSRLAAATVHNPQRRFGADVVSRLAVACDDEGALRELARLVNAELDRLAAELLAEAGGAPQDVALVAIAGNPAMEHLLLGLPVRRLAFPPHRPLFHLGRKVSTAEHGWSLATPAYLFPLPGGFVGGDLVAFLHGQGVAIPSSPPSFTVPSSASRAPEVPYPALFLDIGTNGEIALVTEDGVLATSAAAGPALEGGNLSCGMAALPGAICDAQLAGDRLTLTVLGNGPPRGLCGSGVIAVVARLLEAGVLDPTGRILQPQEISSNLANRVAERQGELVFVLHRDASHELVFSQKDIRQVQLAKGAVRAGIEVLLDRAGIAHDDLREVVLTGSFGAALIPGDLKSIGLFSEKMVQTARFVRDGALVGVERAVGELHGLAAIDGLARAIKVIPLSGTPSFADRFLEQMNFPG